MEITGFKDLAGIKTTGSRQAGKHKAQVENMTVSHTLAQKYIYSDLTGNTKNRWNGSGETIWTQNQKVQKYESKSYKQKNVFMKIKPSFTSSLGLKGALDVSDISQGGSLNEMLKFK